MSHYSVLYQEVLEYLKPAVGQIFVDGTLGAGGHTRGFAIGVGDSGKVIAIDADESAIQLAKQNLSEFQNITYCHSNYSDLKNQLNSLNLKKVNGILLDIGVSSMQIDQAERGFSFRDDRNGQLDMRMDQTSGMTVAKYLQIVPKAELEEVIRDFGEERYYKRIAGAICTERLKRKISTTSDLADIVRAAVPGPKGKIDKATRTFQALRIKINNELGVLEQVIPEALEVLDKGGRLAIISFHSLEDRIVKWAFRKLQEEGVCSILTKKPVLPSDRELNENVRSRSAKLRVLEKL